MSDAPVARLLVIDDNPQNVALVQTQLERAGYVVRAALSGRAGLDMAWAAPPDLILLDVMMPGLDGYEVCRQLRSNDGTRSVPVVMLTSLHDRADKLRALDTGADEFLSKPVDRAELLARVRSLLRQKRLYDELAHTRDEIAQQAHLLAVEKSRAEAILYSMGDGVVTTDLQGRITLLNPAAERISGATFELVVGRTWTEALNVREEGGSLNVREEGGSPVEQANCPLCAALAANQPVVTRSLAVFAPDGRVIRLTVSAAPVRQAGGVPIGGVVVLRDATQQRQALAEAQQLAAIVESSDDAISSHTLDGVVFSWNPGAQRLYGYTAEEMLGRSVAAIFPPERRHEQGEIREKLERGEALKNFETERITKDGTRVHVSLSLSTLKDKNGELISVSAIARDITEHKRAELERARLLEAVERERANLEAVMACMSDGLVLLDGDNTIRYWNDQAAALFGVEPRQVIGRNLKEALALIGQAFADPEETRAAWRRSVARVAEQPSFEARFVAPTPCDVRFQLFPVCDQAGSELGIGVLLRDVTAARELERAKDELVSVVSHELRTPLASLVGFAELLLTREYSEPQRRQYLTVMLEEGRRLTGLINDFLDLQRMESGRQQLAPETLLLGPLVERVVAAMGDDLAHPMRFEIPTDLPMVRADPAAVQQVLTNLLSNARKYSPRGGEVRLSARFVDGWVEVSVADSGLGIPPSALPRLFHKFYRIDNSDRRDITGTGLGLAIAWKLIEAHGGRIWAESPGLGQGSSFFFTLSVAEAARTDGDVLVVENDIGFARLLEAELVAQGLTASHVTGALEALERVRAAPPRAILLDLLLPDIQGEEFLSRLAESGGSVPVVVVTVKDLNVEEQRELERLGSRAVLRKGPGVASRAARLVADALGEHGEQAPWRA